MLLVEIHLHPQPCATLELGVQGLGFLAYLGLVLAAPDRDYDGFDRSELRWYLQAPVIPVHYDQTAYRACRKTPRGLVGIDSFLLLIEERDVEGPGEILAEVVAGGCLQGPSIPHQTLTSVGLDRPSKPLGGALHAGEDGEGQYLVEDVLIDAQHPQGLFASFFGGGVDGVALLPEKLRGAQEGAGHLLPTQDVAPLVNEDG